MGVLSAVRALSVTTGSLKCWRGLARLLRLAAGLLSTSSTKRCSEFVIHPKAVDSTLIVLASLVGSIRIKRSIYLSLHHANVLKRRNVTVSRLARSYCSEGQHVHTQNLIVSECLISRDTAVLGLTPNDVISIALHFAGASQSMGL